MLFSVAWLKAEDWTTTSGTTYHDIKVVEVKGGIVTIRDSDGEAMIEIGKLPPAIQRNLGYDLVKEKSDKQAEQQQQTTDAAEKKKDALQHPSFIWGAVLQVTPDGVIVQCPDADAAMASGNGQFIVSAAARYQAEPVFGVCLLKDYPKQNELADGDRIQVVAYPDENYSYQTTDGSTATIRSFTANPQ